MVKDPKNVVQELVQLVGKPRAEKLLIAQDMSPSTAAKLVRGKYISEVGALLAAAIEKAHSAAGEKAS